MTDEAREAIHRRYRGSDVGVRAVFRDDPQGVSRHYECYVEFVLANLGRCPAVILDIGCGSGWSTASLRGAGHHAIGSDLHEDARQIGQAGIHSAYVTADAQHSLRVVDIRRGYHARSAGAHPGSATRARRMPEGLAAHRPVDNRRAHLLSVGVALRTALVETWTVIRSGGRWPVRMPDTPRHPFGNTPSEAYAALAHHAFHTLRKTCTRAPVRFLMRELDPRPPFHSDNDACYYCNPMDVLLWAKQRGGLRPIRWWAADHGLGHVLWPVLGGTWVVLEKAPTAG